MSKHKIAWTVTWSRVGYRTWKAWGFSGGRKSRGGKWSGIRRLWFVGESREATLEQQNFERPS